MVRDNFLLKVWLLAVKLLVEKDDVLSKCLKFFRLNEFASNIRI